MTDRGEPPTVRGSFDSRRRVGGKENLGFHAVFHNTSWRKSYVLVRDFGGNLLSIISDSLLIQTALCATPSGGEEFKVSLPLPFPFIFR